MCYYNKVREILESCTEAEEEDEGAAVGINAEAAKRAMNLMDDTIRSGNIYNSI